MIKCRIRFEKLGRSCYISHLDLMRTFQHAFIRAGIPIHHTEGFNPHPYLSIALPLPLGSESLCEILDIQLEDGVEPSAVPERLNAALPEGIRALEIWEPEGKVGQLRFTRSRAELFYDDGRAEARREALERFFRRKELIIRKKTKRGFGELDLAGHLRELSVTVSERGTLLLSAVLPAVEPTVNPSNLIDALHQLAPELMPDDFHCLREEVYTENMKIFR